MHAPLQVCEHEYPDRMYINVYKDTWWRVQQQ